MPEWLAQLSAFAVFLGIAGVGFIFLLISLVFGEIFGHFEVSLDHDVDFGGPSFFSTRILSVFITAFGSFGAIATHYGVSPLPASGIGTLSGVIFASIIYGFARFLYGQQATTELKSADLVGKTARVIVGIPASGIGQVRCQLGEDLVDKIARSQDGAAIPENAVVRIEELLGETVVVKRQS